MKSFNLSYPQKSRSIKILSYLNNGCTGYLALRDNHVIGDVWSLAHLDSMSLIHHKDLKWHHIKLNQFEAYMFNLFVHPDERGHGFANALFNFALSNLKNKGIVKVYGFYMADNLPALWMHRMLNYKELKRLRLQRYLCYRSSKLISS